MKQLSLRTGLLALLAFMTLLLLAVSLMGIVAINKGNRSLDVINRIQGIELNSLYKSNSDLMRARANAALAVRKIEIGMLEEGAAVTKLSQADVLSSQKNLKRFVDAGTVTAHGKMLADAVSASYKAYLDQGIKPMMDALDKQYTDEYYQLLEGNLATLAASYDKAVTDFSQFADQVTQAQLVQAAQNETKMKVLIGVAGILTLLLLFLGPIFALLCYMVKRDGGNAIYGHERVGQNGKKFKCLKFRSMVTNSKEVLEKLLATSEEARIEWDKDFKLKNDPRVTRIGSFLRKTSLDELPQLWNVIRGEMSLVGPRPVIEAELERYAGDVDYYLMAKPGMTGLWQVSGRNDIDYDTRVYFDSWYVKNWALWTDIAILFKTAGVVLRRDGAY